MDLDDLKYTEICDKCNCLFMPTIDSYCYGEEFAVNSSCLKCGGKEQIKEHEERCK